MEAGETFVPQASSGRAGARLAAPPAGIGHPGLDRAARPHLSRPARQGPQLTEGVLGGGVGGGAVDDQPLTALGK